MSSRRSIERRARRSRFVRLAATCSTDASPTRRSCEPRAEPPRVVTGIAVRYGDEARISDGFRERIAKGALKLPRDARPTSRCSTTAPCRSGSWNGRTTTDALRFRTELSDGARQDQALQDVRSGLLSGASLEFMPEKEAALGNRQGEGSALRDHEGEGDTALSLVDDGAYPQSSINLRLEQPSADAALRLAIQEGNPRKRDKRLVSWRCDDLERLVLAAPFWFAR